MLYLFNAIIAYFFQAKPKQKEVEHLLTFCGPVYVHMILRQLSFSKNLQDWESSFHTWLLFSLRSCSDLRLEYIGMLSFA